MTTGLNVPTTIVVANVLNTTHRHNNNVGERGFWDAVRDELRSYGIVLTQGVPQRGKSGSFTVVFKKQGLTQAVLWRAPGDR